MDWKSSDLYGIPPAVANQRSGPAPRRGVKQTPTYQPGGKAHGSMAFSATAPSTVATSTTRTGGHLARAGRNTNTNTPPAAPPSPPTLPAVTNSTSSGFESAPSLRSGRGPGAVVVSTNSNTNINTAGASTTSSSSSSSSIGTSTTAAATSGSPLGMSTRTGRTGTPTTAPATAEPLKDKHVDPTKTAASRIERSLRYLYLTRDRAKNIPSATGRRERKEEDAGTGTGSSLLERMYEEIGLVLEGLRQTDQPTLSESPSSSTTGTPPQPVPSPPRGPPPTTSTNKNKSAFQFPSSRAPTMKSGSSELPEERIALLKEVATALPAKAIMLLEALINVYPDCTVAKAELATCLLYGHGVATDVPRALQLLDACVAGGHPGACLAVGRCLRDGVGVPTNLPVALQWIHQAANMGYLPAMHELGEMYEEGVSAAMPCAPGERAEVVQSCELERDLVLSYRWYKAAAEQGYTDAQLNLGKLYLVGLGQQSNSQQNRSQAEDKARYWLEKASANGSLEARGLLQRGKSGGQ